MEHERIDVLERLASADPAPREYDQARADRVLAAILAEPRRKRSARRRLVIAAVLLLVVALAAPALAFDDVRSFLGFQGGPPVLAEAELLVSAPVAEATMAHLWFGTTKDGGECLFTTYGPPGVVERPPELSGGACGWGGQASSRPPGSLSVSSAKRPLKVRGATEWVPPVISGYLDPALRATRVEVRWTGGSKELALRNDYFIGSVEALYEPLQPLLPFELVGLDADGNVVFRRALDAVRLD